MITNYLIAKFNAAAYSHNSNLIKIEGWKELSNSSETVARKSGYYGIAFINEDLKTIVIASSGTNFDLGKKKLDNIKNLLSDLYAGFQIIMHKIPNHFKCADTFVNSIIAGLGPKAADYQFITTGHSLGAVLSNLINVKLAAQNLKVTSINIESPGSKHILDNYIKSQKLDISLDDLKITTYNAPKNLINTFMPEVGEIYEFQVSKPANFINKSFNSFSTDKISDTIYTHHFSNILRFAFDKDTNDYKQYTLVRGSHKTNYENLCIEDNAFDTALVEPHNLPFDN